MPTRSLLTFLTLLAFHSFSHAADFSWKVTDASIKQWSPTPTAACTAYAVKLTNDAGPFVYAFHSVAKSSATEYICWLTPSYRSGGGSIARQFSQITRSGNGCTAPSVFDPLTDSCSIPKDCINNHNVTLEAICTLNTSAMGASDVTCPDKVYYEGCSFRRDTSKDSTKCYWDLTVTPKVYRCQVDYLGGYGSIPPNPDSDAVTCTAAGVCKDSAGNESSLNPWDGDTPSANCYMSNGREICRDPSDSECIKVDGSNSCLADDMQCYYVNLTLQCIPGDKPQRNCSYFSGQYKCFDPKDPSKEIPAGSSDHPDNGGNADGDDTNDPKKPGQADETAQGKDDLATNKSIRDLEDTVGEGLEETNNWLKKIHDQLFGGDYDGSGDGKDAEAESSGRATGDLLAQTITDQTESILEDREEESQEFLDQLPSTVTGWFGATGENVGLAGVLDSVLPASSGCSEYTLSFRLGSYSSSLVLPVCDLTRIKPLLEWVIWMITLVGLWKILYSALRREDVKASKGGF